MVALLRIAVAEIQDNTMEKLWRGGLRLRKFKIAQWRSYGVADFKLRCHGGHHEFNVHGSIAETAGYFLKRVMLTCALGAQVKR